MRITGTQIALLSLAFIAGGIIVWLLISAGARPNQVTVGAIQFEVPTEAATSAPRSNVSQPNAPQPSQPNIPSQSPAINSSSLDQQTQSVELVRREGVSPNSSKTFNVALNIAEVIVGQSYGFNQYKGGCASFLISGPGQFEFSVTDGVWFQYKNVLTVEKAESLLQEQIGYLTKNYPCTPTMVNVSRLP